MTAVIAGTVTTSESAVYLLNATTLRSLTASGDQSKSIVSVRPTTAFTTLINQTGGVVSLSEPTARFYLRLKGNLTSGEITNATIKAYNGTTLITATNYTVYNIIGGTIVSINFTTNKYINDNITFVFNRTFATTDNLYGSSLCYPTTSCLMTVNGSDNYGETHHFILLNRSSELGITLNSLPMNNRNYTVYYTMITYTEGAEALAACESINSSVGDAFSLASIVLLVLAAALVVGVLTMGFGGIDIDIKTAIAGMIVFAMIMAVGYVTYVKVSVALC
jgi:hypothetical protein